jgi:DNA modification methylase
MIINADCLQVLKEMQPETINAVVTDPPYCSGGFSEAGKSNAKGQGLRSETIREEGWFVNDNMTTAGLVWLLRNVAVEVERLLKTGGSMLMFTDWRMVPHLAPALESSGLRYQNMIVWDKMQVGLGRGFRSQHEIILHFTKGTGVYFDKSTGNVLRSKRINAQTRLHQTEKPVELLAQLVKVVTQPGDVVLDPFGGSMSTGETCVRLGRNFVGIDKGRGYCEIGKERLKKAAQTIQTSLFNG